MVTLKITFGEDTRRYTFDSVPSYSALTELVRQLFPNVGNNYTLKYLDEDSDLVTVTSDRELNEAFKQNGSNLLRLTVFNAGEKPYVEISTSTSSPASGKQEQSRSDSTPNPSSTPNPFPGMNFDLNTLAPFIRMLSNPFYLSMATQFLKSWATQNPTAFPNGTPDFASLLKNISSVADIAATIKNLGLDQYLNFSGSNANSNANPNGNPSPFNFAQLFQQFGQNPILQSFLSQMNQPQSNANPNVNATPSANAPPFPDLGALFQQFGQNPFLQSFMNPNSNPNANAPNANPNVNPTPAAQAPPAFNLAELFQQIGQNDMVQNFMSQLNPETRQTDVNNEGPLHPGVLCDVCNKGIRGIRFKCLQCPDYDLCAACRVKPEVHDPSHAFDTIEKPIARASSYVRPSEQYSAECVADVTMPDQTHVVGGQKYIKTWKFKNTGTNAWPVGTRLVATGGDKLSASDAVEVPSVWSRWDIEISVEVSTPNQPGRYISYWKLADDQGNKFGPQVWVDVVVIAPGAPSTDSPAMEFDSAPIRIPVQMSDDVAPPPAPREMYETQIQQLLEMGFTRDPEILRKFLGKNNGDVFRTIQDLLTTN